jgi:hypothetical protein
VIVSNHLGWAGSHSLGCWQLAVGLNFIAYKKVVQVHESFEWYDRDCVWCGIILGMSVHSRSVRVKKERKVGGRINNTIL